MTSDLVVLFSAAMERSSINNSERAPLRHHENQLISLVKLFIKAVIKAGFFCCLSWVILTSAPLAVKAAINLDLTPEERAWLLEHGDDIRLGPAPDWEPIEFFDENGAYRGLVADYMGLIQRRLGIRFKIIRSSSWSETLARAQQREIDVLPAAQSTSERRTFMLWSKPYIHINTTIIVRKEMKGQVSLEEMREMRIGVPKDYAVGRFIRETYPELTLIEVDTNEQGLFQVSFGELDAMITEIPSALYIIEQEKITNLRLSGDTGFELHHGIGVRSDWPLFASIIEKTLASITEAEHQEMYSRWLHLQPVPFYVSNTFWYWVGAIFAFIVTLIGGVISWNRILKRQVLHRTEEIRFNEMRMDALLQLNERSNDSIQELIAFAFEQMIQLTKSRFGYLAFDDQEGMLYSIRSRDAAARKPPTTATTTGFTTETQGLWGKAVLKKEPVISNYYPVSNPEMKGLPEGCRTLVRYMNVPICKDGQVVVVAGVGNKSQDYDTSDLRQLTLLTQGLWRRLQRKQQEQALARNEKSLRDIVENSPNGITIIQNGQVVYRNTKQLELLGDINPGTTSLSYEHIHAEDKETVEAFYKCILAGQPDKMELDFKFYTSLENRTKANLRWVTTLITPINYRDDTAFLLTTLDRTRARELEHLLTMHDKMATLGRIAAGIGHEIRNPLSGINIYLHALEKGLADPKKAHKIAPAIEGIRTASEKMEAVVKRVIDFSKPIDPKFVEIDVNEPVREAAQLAGMSMKKYGVQLSLDLAKDLARCDGEHNLIEEVVLNMMNNSVDAMNGQENSKQIRISTFLEKGAICIAVEDSGPGVPADLVENIFEPFYTTKDYSTGIGLALSHRIITDHNGRINVVKSSLGGARFVIELPLSQASAQQPKPQLNQA